jgi:hypothetical protein
MIVSRGRKETLQHATQQFFHLNAKTIFPLRLEISISVFTANFSSFLFLMEMYRFLTLHPNNEGERNVSLEIVY